MTEALFAVVDVQLSALLAAQVTAGVGISNTAWADFCSRVTLQATASLAVKASVETTISTLIQSDQLGANLCLGLQTVFGSVDAVKTNVLEVGLGLGVSTTQIVTGLGILQASSTNFAAVKKVVKAEASAQIEASIDAQIQVGAQVVTQKGWGVLDSFLCLHRRYTGPVKIRAYQPTEGGVSVCPSKHYQAGRPQGNFPLLQVVLKAPILGGLLGAVGNVLGGLLGGIGLGVRLG